MMISKLLTRSFTIFALFVASLSSASAAKLPVDVTGLKLDIVKIPAEWTYTEWTTKGGDIYILYSGDLYKSDGSPRKFEIDLKFDAQSGYKSRK